MHQFGLCWLKREFQKRTGRVGRNQNPARCLEEEAGASSDSDQSCCCWWFWLKPWGGCAAPPPASIMHDEWGLADMSSMLSRSSAALCRRRGGGRCSWTGRPPPPPRLVPLASGGAGPCNLGSGCLASRRLLVIKANKVSRDEGGGSFLARDGSGNLRSCDRRGASLKDIIPSPQTQHGPISLIPPPHGSAEYTSRSCSGPSSLSSSQMGSTRKQLRAASLPCCHNKAAASGTHAQNRDPTGGTNDESLSAGATDLRQAPACTWNPALSPLKEDLQQEKV